MQTARARAEARAEALAEALAEAPAEALAETELLRQAPWRPLERHGRSAH